MFHLGSTAALACWSYQSGAASSSFTNPDDVDVGSGLCRITAG